MDKINDAIRLMQRAATLVNSFYQHHRYLHDPFSGGGCGPVRVPTLHVVHCFTFTVGPHIAAIRW